MPCYGPQPRNAPLLIKRHAILIKGEDSKHYHESPANKDSDNMVNLEDEKEEKAQIIQRKRHISRVRRIRLKRINLDFVYLVSIDGGMFQ